MWSDATASAYNMNRQKPRISRLLSVRCITIRSNPIVSAARRQRMDSAIRNKCISLLYVFYVMLNKHWSFVCSQCYANRIWTNKHWSCVCSHNALWTGSGLSPTSLTRTLRRASNLNHRLSHTVCKQMGTEYAMIMHTVALLLQMLFSQRILVPPEVTSHLLPWFNRCSS